MTDDELQTMLRDCTITLTIDHAPTGLRAYQCASGREVLTALDPKMVNRRLAGECLRLLADAVSAHSAK